jgi:hypothetical protein
LVEIESRAVAGEEGAGPATATVPVAAVAGKKTEKAAATMPSGSTGLPKRNRKKFVAPVAKIDPDSIEKAHQEAR